MFEKHVLRKKSLEKRKLLSIENIEKQSRKIVPLLFELVEKHMPLVIHCYEDARDGEIDLQYFVQKLHEQYPSIIVLGSEWSINTRQMKAIDKKTGNEWVKNIDMILIPGIVFNQDKQRIGYGMGFYDRFLTNHLRAIKVGACHLFQHIDATWEYEPHDIVMDKVVHI